MTTQAGPVTPVGARPFDTATPRPTHLTGFVGRDTELAEVRTLLGSIRLLTLTGGGGSGKTRLASEFASRFGADTYDEVAWVDLAPLTDENLLTRHVSAELGLVEELGRSALDALAARICRLRLLLVLDNCEHLVSACAALCRTLLQACPNLRILTTSREALGVDGETAWLIPSLSVPATDEPDPAELDRSEAIRLFVDRARAVRPGFTIDDGNRSAVAHICRRLDGIPLALELAAARTRVLTAAQIADRLDDVFGLLSANRRSALPRHRTLREAIDWSYALLDDGERTLFRRLAVFRGGWTLSAAEAICADDALSGSEVLDRLTALVDKSLARADVGARESRFTFLEPVRQYAMGELQGCGEVVPIRARHAAFFLDLAEVAEPHIRGGTRNTEWMNRLEVEHANIRASLEWFGEADARLPDQLRLDVSLLWFHFAQGLFGEPRDRIAGALLRAGDISPRLRGRTLTALGYQSKWLGDFAGAFGPLEAAVDLLRGSGDPEALSLALTGLGAVLGGGENGPAAYRHFDEAQSVLGGREACEAHGFPRLLLYAFASYWRGMVAQSVGDITTARSAFEVSADVARCLDGHPSIAHPLAALAHICLLEGDFDSAARLFAESVGIHVRNGDRWALTRAFAGGARLAALRSDPERASRLLGASDRIRESMGATLPPHERVDRAQLTEMIRAAAGWEAFEKQRAAGRTMTIEKAAAVMTITHADGPSLAAADPIATEAPSPARAGVRELDRSGEDLRIEALGPLAIYCGGEVVDGGRWGSAKPRELLLFLLTRPEGASREQVGLALWPDAMGDKVANNFHVTLHRLRKALGHSDWVVSSGDRYRVSPDIACYFDAAAFEDGVRGALRQQPTAPETLERLASLLDTYRGPFLEDEVVGDWHLDIRDRLTRLHVEGLAAVGQALMHDERYPEAVEVYRKAIASDDLHEPAYRQLMTCLARSGDRPQALRLYQRLETLLADELDTQPEDETRELYDRLRSAAPVT